MEKLAMLILLPLLLLCYRVGNVHCAHQNRRDLHSLLDFKGLTIDPNGALSNWTTSTHFCRWNGVKCTRGRVSNLTLSDQSLAGNISSSLANLTFLSVLDLSYNNFFGQLPPLSDLQQLDTLFLNGNLLEGNIPDSLTNCTKLRQLDLNSNQLSGTIPPKVNLLPKLEYLDLSYNQLTGIIPPALGNLTVLNFCNLMVNKLNGRIPEGIWQLSKMQILTLGNNSLSGEISPAINMSSLQILGLEFNMLDKTLPSTIGYALPSLTNLTLDGNRFEGQIPASLGNALMLLQVDLSQNRFTGHIPASLGNLSSLDFLNLEINKLQAGDRQSWEFLYALTNCKSLTKLSLYDNQLQGDIPDSVGNLSTSLQTLLLGANKLSGKIPSTIGNLHNLFKLGLAENSLVGGIGEWIGKLKNLEGLFLQENMLNGPIPSSISNLTQLSVLNVSYNNLNGIIPPEIGNLKKLDNLYLSSNKLTGNIPESLGQCQNLVAVQMDQNFLTGYIPASLGNLKSLNVLNLSHNSLSGRLPVNLQLLSTLDLSYNNFEGQIPTKGVFADATVVSLGGNKGLCGGVVSLHMPPCPTVSHKIEMQYYLIRVLIPVFGFMSLALLVYFLLLVNKTRRRKYQSLNSFGKDFLKVSYNDLAQATRNFSESNLVGRGSYGSVYKGKLKEHKMEVAVKVFNLEMQGAERSFLSECEALRSIQHRNLLPIITACSTVDNNGDVFKALVYEFMPNGNLDTLLHYDGEGESPRKHLSLAQRLSIVVNIADALDYLHFDCGRPTVHCDLKPSNILLDDDMTALLGDFGIARFYADSSSTSAYSVGSIGLRGTIGYIAPEYGHGGHATTAGDAYSFGIVLLEMLVGKRPTDPMFKDGVDIVNFVESNFPHQIHYVLDPHLTEECKDISQRNMAPEYAVSQCVISLFQIALSCTRALPSERMDMKQIATKMQAIKTATLQWKTKRSS